MTTTTERGCRNLRAIVATTFFIIYATNPSVHGLQSSTTGTSWRRGSVAVDTCQRTGRQGGLSSSKLPPVWTTHTRYRDRTSFLSSPDSNNSRNRTAKGVYVRPSAVIEKGSGFFVPGLEGARVRLAVGVVLLAATATNHFLSTSVSAFSEALGAVYALLVLLQGAIETSKEGRQLQQQQEGGRVGSSITGTSQSSTAMIQQWRSDGLKDDTWRDKVQWAATSFVALTPATHMILLRQSTPNDENGTLEYWLGATGTVDFTSGMQAGIAAALKTIQQSKGGRVALPADHPAAIGLLPDEYRRCVVLQRLEGGDVSCWMVASNDLLASFTRQDLQWLGQLARYVSIQ